MRQLKTQVSRVGEQGEAQMRRPGVGEEKSRAGGARTPASQEQTALMPASAGPLPFALCPWTLRCNTANVPDDWVLLLASAFGDSGSRVHHHAYVPSHS